MQVNGDGKGGRAYMESGNVSSKHLRNCPSFQTQVSLGSSAVFTGWEKEDCPLPYF